jgi:hypothetical protein
MRRRNNDPRASYLQSTATMATARESELEWICRWRNPTVRQP